MIECSRPAWWYEPDLCHPADDELKRAFESDIDPDELDDESEQSRLDEFLSDFENYKQRRENEV